MIRKSGYRFSEKIMLNKTLKRDGNYPIPSRFGHRLTETHRTCPFATLELTQT